MASQTEIRSFFKKRSKSAEDVQQDGEGSWKKARTELTATEPAVAPKGDQAAEPGLEETAVKKEKKSEKQHRAISEIKGDLFSCPKSAALAHCVSEDLRLGKGIAKLFRDKFGGIDEMRRQKVKVGGVAVIRRPGGSAYVYNLVTKEKFWQKPTYDSLRRSLQAMSAHMQANNVAMPRIGCGLDGLQWSSVRAVIDEVFQVGSADSGETGVKIVIYSI